MRQPHIRFTLPSGRSVLLSLVAVPERPWDVRQEGSHYVVVREKRGNREDLQLYINPYNRKTIVLETRRDALALATALNEHRSTRHGVEPDPDAPPTVDADARQEA